MNEQIKFGKLLSFIDKIVEKKRDCSRSVKILRYKKLVKIYSSSFGNIGESNLKEEERLAEEIQKLPCLYDKGNEGYKEKDRKKNAWCEVEKALSFEEGSAARAFETLKKKYRKPINFQKSSRSGSFLRWLDPFIRPPKTKTNKPKPSVEINESSNAGDELKNNGYDSEESEDAGFDVMTVSPSYWQRSGNQLHRKNISNRSNKQAAVKQNSMSLKKVNQAEIMGAELDVMRDTSKLLNKRLTSMNDERQDDEDDLFGKLVAAELKSLPQRQKYRLKHEINNLVFNYKLQNENDVNYSERSASKIQSPTFHAEVNRSFHNAGHWLNDMQNYMTP